MTHSFECKPDGETILITDSTIERPQNDSTFETEEIIEMTHTTPTVPFPTKTVFSLAIVSIIVAISLGTLPGYSLPRTLLAFTGLYLISILPYLWLYREHRGNHKITLQFTNSEPVTLEFDSDDGKTVRNLIENYHIKD